MLQLLKETVSSRHSERLEQIVIILIAIEIGELSCCVLLSGRLTRASPLVLGICTILVDLMA